MTWWDEHKRRAQARSEPEPEPDEQEQLAVDAEQDYDQELAEIDAELAAEDLKQGSEQGMGDLPEWAQRVEDFGGRIGSPQRVDALQQLSQGQLGTTFTLPTSEAAPVYPDAVLLAQVALDQAVPLDVTFAYPNMKAQPGVVQNSLDAGDGFVRVTWGAPGAIQFTADIDGNRGWRHPFTASFLRLEYIPIDIQGSVPLASSQARDLIVAGMITPSLGGPRTTLTKTEKRPLIPPLSFGVFRIPQWAKSVKFATPWNDNLADWFAIMFDAQGVNIQTVGKLDVFAARGWDGAATEWPVPQGAQILHFFWGDDNQDLILPSVVFALDL